MDNPQTFEAALAWADSAVQAINDLLDERKRVYEPSETADFVARVVMTSRELGTGHATRFLSAGAAFEPITVRSAVGHERRELCGFSAARYALFEAMQLVGLDERTADLEELTGDLTYAIDAVGRKSLRQIRDRLAAELASLRNAERET